MDVVITRHVVMPRELPDKSDPIRCVIGYYGTMEGKPLAVIVGTTKAGDRWFQYAEPAEPSETRAEPLTEAEMIAAVRAYGFRDGMPDST